MVTTEPILKEFIKGNARKFAVSFPFCSRFKVYDLIDNYVMKLPSV